MDLYNFVTFNCKNVKRSVEDVRRLCRTSHIIALQEHWLMPHDIDFLSSIDDEFAYTGVSPMDLSKGMISGRPWGGVSLLWNKKIFENVSIVKCDNTRMCAIKIVKGQRSLLVFSVYMPTDKTANLVEFTDCLGSLAAIVGNEDAECVYILGDFNAHPGEQFYHELSNFCSDLEWTCADVGKLGLFSDTYSFISDANGCASWLDHCVVTKSALQTVVNAHVEYDPVWSDHLPLIIQCNLNLIKPKILRDKFNDMCNNCNNNKNKNNDSNVNNNNNNNKVRWGERNQEQIKLYVKLCNEKFKQIDYPKLLCNCSDKHCNELDHRPIIDRMYRDIIDVLCMAACNSCSFSQPSKKNHVIGWNKHVREAHREARLKFKLWALSGKRRVGRAWDEMRESRSLFKSRLKWCQNNSEQIKMDILATQHSKHDFRTFWKTTNKLNSRPSLPVSVNKLSDSKCIADMFRDHFTVTSPLGPSRSVTVDGCHGQEIITRITAQDVKKVITSMSRGKSPGHDSLSIEHLKCAGDHLPRVLAMFYKVCIGHSYLPAEMMRAVVVPIVKSKTGDIGDHNNYRPISLATIVAKVFDGLLSTQLDKYMKIHDNQFGFKSGVSTEAAILCLKQTVKYYTDRSTPIYACFLDLSKAFDLVSYDILWKKMHDLSIPEELVYIFKYWYLNQDNVVRWSNALSEPYRLECGVRQGGRTSPKLFNCYVNALIEDLSSTRVGCHIDGVCLNNISYADDMVLLGASVCGLTRLLGVCERYAQSHGLLYNEKKSECMVFRARGEHPDTMPSIRLNDSNLKRVEQFKYLGHIVTSDLRDDADLERERRALSVRANMIARRFARCSRAVKITLFRAFCTSFYTSSLWVTYTQKQYNALRVQYNNAFRTMMGLPRHCSASGMFAEWRVDCFHTTMRKRCTSLARRVRASPAIVLSVFANRFDCQYINHCCMVHVLTNKQMVKCQRL